MTIFIRKVGEVADGSITEIKLADSAVNLGSVKVTGQAPSTRIEDGAITTSKIADLNVTDVKLADGGVTTTKLAEASVTTAKAVDALRRHVYVGDETEVSVIGATPTEIKTFTILKAPAILNWLKLHIQAEMKTSNATYKAIIKVFVDAEASPRITLESNNLAYELQSNGAVISDLSNGAHTVKIKMYSEGASATAWNDLIEVFTEI